MFPSIDKVKHRGSPDILETGNKQAIKRGSPDLVKRSSPEISDARRKELVKRNSPDIVDARRKELAKRNSPDIVDARRKELVKRNSPDIVDARRKEHHIRDSPERRGGLSHLRYSFHIGDTSPSKLPISKRQGNKLRAIYHTDLCLLFFVIYTRQRLDPKAFAMDWLHYLLYVLLSTRLLMIPTWLQYLVWLYNDSFAFVIVVWCRGKLYIGLYFYLKLCTISCFFL